MKTSMQFDENGRDWSAFDNSLARQRAAREQRGAARPAGKAAPAAATPPATRHMSPAPTRAAAPVPAAPARPVPAAPPPREVRTVSPDESRRDREADQRAADAAIAADRRRWSGDSALRVEFRNNEAAWLAYRVRERAGDLGAVVEGVNKPGVMMTRGGVA